MKEMKKEIKVVTYNDGLLNRNRRKYAGFVLDGEFIPFDEAEEKNVAVIKRIESERAGKWSNSTYEVFTKSATFVMIYRPFEYWSDDLEEVVNHVIRINKEIDNEITQKEAEIAVKNLLPKLWERVNKKENKINSLV